MKKVLIVEGKKEIADDLKKIVVRADGNAKVFCAASFEEAVLISVQENIELMLVDVILDSSIQNDISGLRFVREIRRMEQYKFVPVIIITALEDTKLYSYRELHCYDFIEKPYDPKKIFNIIKEVLPYRTVRKQNQKYIYRKEGIIYSILQEDIVYIQNFNKRLIVKTVNEFVDIPYKPLSKLLDELNDSDFVQSSRNYIINKKYVEHVDTVNRMIKMKGETCRIDIGVAFKKQVMAEFT